MVSPNATYHFKAENEDEFKEWVSVLRNIKNEALDNTFKGNTSDKPAKRKSTNALEALIRNQPGNDECCDCGSQNGQYMLFCNSNF